METYIKLARYTNTVGCTHVDLYTFLIAIASF